MSLIWATLLYPVNDITTTPDQPPAYVHILKLEANQGRDLSYKEAARSRQQRLYSDLKPLHTKLGANELFKRALTVTERQLDWKVIDVDEANFRIEAVATTPLLKFADDVIIEVRPETGGSSLHMRSKSRLGRGDFGTNYKRIQGFLNLLQK